MENKYMNNIPIKTIPNGDPLLNEDDVDNIPKEDLPNRVIMTEDSAADSKKQKQ